MGTNRLSNSFRSRALLLTFFCVLAAKPYAHEQVDAAVFNDITETYYFFFGETFIPKKLGKPLNGGGRLAKFGENLPAKWESGIDAAVFNSNTEKYYFFKRINKEWMFIEKGFGRGESFTEPKHMDDFASNDFPSQCGIHAATYDPIRKIYYFFKRNGDFCSKEQGSNPFVIRNGKFDGNYPDQFDLRAVALRTGTSSENRYFFFSNNNYVSKVRGQPFSGMLLSNRQNWENWPALHNAARKTKPIGITVPEAIFTNPRKAYVDKPSLTLRNRLLKLINAAESEIVVEMFIFDDPTLVKALVRAHERGVYVRVIYDLQRRQKDTARRIHPDFPPGSIDELHEVSRTAIMHNKVGLFDSVATQNGSLEHVVFTASANMYPGAYEKYQDALVIADENIYDGFIEQSHNIVIDDVSYVKSVGGSDRNLRAYFFPRNGKDTAEDILYRIVTNQTYPNFGKLKSIDVKINMGSFTRSVTRSGLRQQLIDIGAMDGGSVEIMVTASKPFGSKDDRYTHADVMKQFQNKRGVEVHLLNENAHSKYMLVKASFENANGKTKTLKIVYAGSHNFTATALRENYENWIKITSSKIYNKYSANFRQILKEEGLL